MWGLLVGHMSLKRTRRCVASFKTENQTRAKMPQSSMQPTNYNLHIWLMWGKSTDVSHLHRPFFGEGLRRWNWTASRIVVNTFPNTNGTSAKRFIPQEGGDVYGEMCW